MDDYIFWAIIALFYAPLHFTGPIGVVILTTADPLQRRALIKWSLIESAVTMIVAFALVITLASQSLGYAMGILFVSLLIPYMLLLVHRTLSRR